MLNLLVSLFVGLVAGFVTCRLLKVEGTYLLFCLLGLAGSAIGYLLQKIPLIGRLITKIVGTGGLLPSLIMAVIGSCLLVIVVRLIRGKAQKG